MLSLLHHLDGTFNLGNPMDCQSAINGTVTVKNKRNRCQIRVVLF